MKKWRWIAVIVLILGMAFVWSGCEDSGGGEPVVTFDLSATQGPNKNVIEPEEAFEAVPTADFFLVTEAEAEAKVAEVLMMVLGATSYSVGISFVPHDLVLDSMTLGLVMGDIAADPTITAEEACNELYENLIDETGGTISEQCFTQSNCTITSQEQGEVTVDFGEVVGCKLDSSITNNDGNIGTITVRGKIIDEPLYPAYDHNLPYDCADAGVDCVDVKVAGVSNNFGTATTKAVDEVRFSTPETSVVAGYIFNYDLESYPSLFDLPLFLIANMQIENENMTLIVGLPEGLTNLLQEYYGGVIDATGAMYGLGRSAADEITIVTLPVTAGGDFCQSVFILDQPNVGEIQLNDGLSDDCGLCPSLIIDTSDGSTTCPP